MKKALRMITAGILIGLGSVMLPGCGSSNGTSTSVSQKAPQSDMDKYKAACMTLKQDYTKLMAVYNKFYENHKNQKDKYPLVDYLKEYNDAGFNDKIKHQLDAKVENDIRTLDVDSVIHTHEMVEEMKTLPEAKRIIDDMETQKQIYYAMRDKNKNNQKVIEEMNKFDKEQNMPNNLVDFQTYQGLKLVTGTYLELEHIALNKQRTTKNLFDKPTNVSNEDCKKAKKYLREYRKKIGWDADPRLEDNV